MAVISRPKHTRPNAHRSISLQPRASHLRKIESRQIRGCSVTTPLNCVLHQEHSEKLARNDGGKVFTRATMVSCAELQEGRFLRAIPGIESAVGEEPSMWLIFVWFRVNGWIMVCQVGRDENDRFLRDRIVAPFEADGPFSCAEHVHPRVPATFFAKASKQGCTLVNIGRGGQRLSNFLLVYGMAEQLYEEVRSNFRSSHVERLTSTIVQAMLATVLVCAANISTTWWDG